MYGCLCFIVLAAHSTVLKQIGLTVCLRRSNNTSDDSFLQGNWNPSVEQSNIVCMVNHLYNLRVVHKKMKQFCFAPMLELIHERWNGFRLYKESLPFQCLARNGSSQGYSPLVALLTQPFHLSDLLEVFC